MSSCLLENTEPRKEREGGERGGADRQIETGSERMRERWKKKEKRERELVSQLVS